jgi:large subunit ribosomal protein L5
MDAPGPDAPEATAPETAVPETAVPETTVPETATTRKSARKGKPKAAPEPAPADDAAPDDAGPDRGASDATQPAPAPSRTAAGRAAAQGLRARYLEDIVPALRKQFEYRNPNEVPRLQKIVVNVGLGEALTNAKAIDAATGDLTMITGQRPVVTRARRSIAQFRIRTGNPIGLKVTLRGQRMWDFLERLTMLALPRIRDFRGIPGRSFDGRGNYSLGLQEQIAFPEIDYDKVDRLRGLEVSIVTTAKTDEESKRLLELLGMPFAS